MCRVQWGLGTETEFPTQGWHDDEKRLEQSGWNGPIVWLCNRPAKTGERAKILAWPVKRWTMGDDASQQDEATHSEHGFTLQESQTGPAEIRHGGFDRLERRTQPGAMTRENCAHYCDRTPMTDDQRELAVRYMPMAEALARRACLHRAVATRRSCNRPPTWRSSKPRSTFDPSRKVRFATYARHRIRGALRDYRRLVLAEGSRADPAHRPVFETFRADIEEYRKCW